LGAGGRYGKSRVIASNNQSLPLFGVMAGLVPAIYVCLHEGLQKDLDAREDQVPAASRGEASLRGHDGGRRFDQP